MKLTNRLALAVAMTLTFGAAHADVVVVVSAKSSASKLTKDQVADIFLGRSTSLVPLDQAAGSPVRDEFYTKVAGQTAAQVKTLWAKLSFSGKGTPPKALGGDDEVKAQLAANPNAIAYMEKSKVDASVKTVFEP
jgi:ABC-type phosphate transport system substrate-binding protein